MLYTEEEIRDFILSTLNDNEHNGVCKKVYVSKRCHDESTFDRIIKKMKDSNEIAIDSSFIFLPK